MIAGHNHGAFCAITRNMCVSCYITLDSTTAPSRDPRIGLALQKHLLTRYGVVHAESIAKIRPDAPLEKVPRLISPNK